MNNYLEQLVEIAKIDKEIDSFEPRIAEAKVEITGLITQRDELIKKVDILHDEEKELSLKIAKNDTHLADLNKKSEDIAKKWKAVKTEKENKALALEEEILKEQITFANEEIERLSKNKQLKKSEIDLLQEQIASLDEQEKVLEENVKGVLEDIKEQRQEISTKKELLTSQMDQKIIVFYEKIRKWAKNTSVVAVYKQACGGCFIRLNDKTYTDILKNEDIITCPHCGRILYIKKQEHNQAQTVQKVV